MQFNKATRDKLGKTRQRILSLFRTRRSSSTSSTLSDEDKKKQSEDKANQKEVVVRAMRAMRTFALSTNAKGLQGLRDEYAKLQQRGPYPQKVGDTQLTIGIQGKNRSKCRYHDIPCIDQTRVILEPWPETSNDFIHANWVTSPNLSTRFICTQGPLESTAGDFWRMVWQEHVELIIMLTRTTEAKSKKCVQYWPNVIGESTSYLGISIKAEEILKDDPDIVSTTLSVTYGSEKRRVYHHQWVTWPDKFVPKLLVAPFSLLSMARLQKYPVIVHCSAGIGRTGTLVVLESVLQSLLGGRETSVSDIIWTIRGQRAKAVQSEEQYLYIHYLTIQRLVNKGVVPDSLAKNFCRDYEQFYYSRTHEVQEPLPAFSKKQAVQSSTGGNVTESETTASDTQKSASASASTSNTSIQKGSSDKKGKAEEKQGAASSEKIDSTQKRKETAKEAHLCEKAEGVAADHISQPEKGECDDMDYVFMQPEYAGKYAKYSKVEREVYVFEEMKRAETCVGGVPTASKNEGEKDEASVYLIRPQSTVTNR